MPATAADPPVLTERRGAVATVTLNRPEAGNALTVAAKTALLAELVRLGGEGSVRAVVLTGAGRAFCTGQDLVEHQQALTGDRASAVDTVREHYAPIIRALTGMPKPVIAAVNGACAGAGLGLALACDLRVAAAGARFATAFTGIGLTADAGLSRSLQRAIGSSRAAGLLLLGTPVGAQEALEMGLVHRVVPPEELAGAAAELAEGLAAGPTRAYAAVKEALRFAATASEDEVLEREAQLQEELARTADHAGAVAAFLAKERPTFAGR